MYAAKNDRRLAGFATRRSTALETYAWPGNIRELENVVERAVVLARARASTWPTCRPRSPGRTPLPEGVLTIRIGTPLAEVTARLLEETLRVTKGNKTLTASSLGIDVRPCRASSSVRTRPTTPTLPLSPDRSRAILTS